MYLDFDDHRPETPRVPTVISVREAVLLSLVAHMALLIAILLAPDWFFRPSPEETLAAVPPDNRHITFVEMAPLVDKSAPPIRDAEASDLDRRATTRERAPVPDNTAPMSRGNTPEKVEGGVTERAAGPETPNPGPPAEAAPPQPDAGTGLTPPTPAIARPAGGNLGRSLRNLQQYLKDQNYDNASGGDAAQSADIQFDSMGVDFGPWLRRFKAQVERNWIVPQVAELMKGRVVIQFYVLRNGTIVGLQVVDPAMIPALTSSALNALKLSNPTSALPLEYPADRVFFTVTFHYNDYTRN